MRLCRVEGVAPGGEGGRDGGGRNGGGKERGRRREREEGESDCFLII